MSSEEQDAAIGRLIRERTEANRQRALIADEVTNKFALEASHLFGHLGGVFKGDPSQIAGRLKGAIGIVDALTALGGMDRLKALLSEHLQLSQRISEIGVTLKNAGAE